MEKSFWQKYKQIILFVVVFLVAFFGTRALVSYYRNKSEIPTKTMDVKPENTVKLKSI